MPISTTCPECGAKYNLAEAMAGKKIKCKKCEAVIAVPQADEDDEGVTAAAPRAGASARRPRRDDDDDRDDRDDDDRPSRPVAKKSGGGSTVLLVVGGVLLVLLLVCGGAIGFFIWGLRQAGQAVAEGAKKFGEQIELEAKKQAEFAKQLDRAPTAPATAVTLDPTGMYTDRAILTRGGPQDAGRPAKIYRVQLEQGKRYQIDLSSGEFDCELFLFGPDGRMVTRDDDSGGNLNSRIIIGAPLTGDYLIRATCHTSALRRDPANFTFTIRRQ